MDPTTQRAEWIERQALLSFHQACPASVRARLGLGHTELGPVLATYARRSSTILFNRALGLGCERLTTCDDVRAIAEYYRSMDVSDYLIHLHRSETQATDAQLTRLGLQKGRGWRKFFRRAKAPGASETFTPSSHEAAPRTASTLCVRRVHPDDGVALSRFGAIVCRAFDLEEDLVPVFPALAQDQRWFFFMSFAGETAAGTGALFVARHPETGTHCAWTDFGATAPPFRRRGGQASVLAARVQLADDLGCDEVMTTTGEAVPGDPQHSYKNILRNGFVEGPLRENWRPIHRSEPDA